MSVEYYTHLRELLKSLNARGAKVADRSSNTKAAKIHAWLDKAEYCLADAGDVVQNELSSFRNLRQAAEFVVDETSLDYKISEITDTATRLDLYSETLSNSAYRPSMPDPQGGRDRYEADVIKDFSFPVLQKLNEILAVADTTLKSKGLAGQTLGEQLRAARDHAHDTQEEAAAKIDPSLRCDHKYISAWEAGNRRPSARLARKIRDYIKKANQL